MPSSENNNNNGQLVPEAVLKRKHDLDDLKAKRAAQLPRGKRRKYSTTKAIKVNKAETFIANGRARRNNEIRYKRVLKKGMQKRASNKKVVVTKQVHTDQDDDEEPKTVSYQANSVGAPMVFCVRIRDHVGCPKTVKTALSRIRLNNIHEGVFCRYNESLKKLLHLVEPWVIYGIPSPGVVQDLIHRRGHGKIKGERVPLSNNTIIEDALGESTGIICVEDLVHELTTVGTNFSQANTFLWPFLLSAPKSKFETKQLNEKQSRNDYGDKGEQMDEIIKQML